MVESFLRLAHRLGGMVPRVFVGAAIIAGLGVYAPHDAATQHRLSAPFADSGVLTLVTDGTAGDIDPASNESDPSDLIARNIDNQLVSYDGARIDRFVPALATAWQSNADKSVWVFHLRRDVRFHTGWCCMTAADVKYSIERTVEAGLAGSYLFGRFLGKPSQQIKIRDPYTIEFDLGVPQPFFLGAVASEYTGPVLDARALTAHEKQHDWGHAWAIDHDLGTGPYTIQRWAHGQQVTLARFSGYWGGWQGPHFSTIAVRTVPEASTRRELVLQRYLSLGASEPIRKSTCALSVLGSRTAPFPRSLGVILAK